MQIHLYLFDLISDRAAGNKITMIQRRLGAFFKEEVLVKCPVVLSETASWSIRASLSYDFCCASDHRLVRRVTYR